MSAATLIIECGVAETRAALIADERVQQFWFGPARGDEAEDWEARARRKFIGRVKSIDRGLNAAFVDIGNGSDAFLPINKTNAPHVVAGALITCVVKSPPRQKKGPVLRFLKAADETAAPGRIAPFEDAALEAVRAIGADVDEILIDDGRAKAALAAAIDWADIRHELHATALFERHGANTALAEAFKRRVAVPGGGALTIDEAEALTAIDVDTEGLSGASPARLREKVALAAAYEAAHQVSLRNIGGHVVIDFPPIDESGARARFQKELKKAVAGVKGASAAGFSRSGLFSFTAPHAMQSLLERFTERSSSDPIAGRRFTTRWLAISTMRALEERMRANPRGQMALALGETLYAEIGAHTVWTTRLRDRYGARFEILTSDALNERSYDLSEK